MALGTEECLSAPCPVGAQKAEEDAREVRPVVNSMYVRNGGEVEPLPMATQYVSNSQLAGAPVVAGMVVRHA